MASGTATSQQQEKGIARQIEPKASDMKSVAVDPTTQDEVRKTSVSKYITDREALILFRQLQAIAGDKFPEITTSKGERVQLVENEAGKYTATIKGKSIEKYQPASFFLSYERGVMEYYFDKNGKYTHGQRRNWHPGEQPSKEANGIKSQELLKEIKNYVDARITLNTGKRDKE